MWGRILELDFSLCMYAASGDSLYAKFCALMLISFVSIFEVVNANLRARYEWVLYLRMDGFLHLMLKFQLAVSATGYQRCTGVLASPCLAGAALHWSYTGKCRFSITAELTLQHYIVIWMLRQVSQRHPFQMTFSVFVRQGKYSMHSHLIQPTIYVDMEQPQQQPMGLVAGTLDLLTMLLKVCNLLWTKAYKIISRSICRVASQIFFCLH